MSSDFFAGLRVHRIFTMKLILESLLLRSEDKKQYEEYASDLVRNQVHAAGSAQSITGTNWNIITTDNGCIAYLTGAYFNDQKKITWSGNCQKGQAISGKGNLTLWFDRGDKFFLSGQFVGGYPNGKISGGGSNGSFNENLEMGCRPLDEPKCSSTRPSGGTSAKDDPKVVSGSYRP